MQANASMPHGSPHHTTSPAAAPTLACNANPAAPTMCRVRVAFIAPGAALLPRSSAQANLSLMLGSFITLLRKLMNEELMQVIAETRYGPHTERREWTCACGACMHASGTYMGTGAHLVG